MLTTNKLNFNLIFLFQYFLYGAEREQATKWRQLIGGMKLVRQWSAAPQINKVDLSCSSSINLLFIIVHEASFIHTFLHCLFSSLSHQTTNQSLSLVCFVWLRREVNCWIKREERLLNGCLSFTAAHFMALVVLVMGPQATTPFNYSLFSLSCFIKEKRSYWLKRSKESKWLMGMRLNEKEELESKPITNYAAIWKDLSFQWRRQFFNFFQFNPFHQPQRKAEVFFLIDSIDFLKRNWWDWLKRYYNSK